MTLRLADRGIGAVLLDIEGTTTPIAFVHDELFPFARRRLESHLRAHWREDATGHVVRLLADEHTTDQSDSVGDELPAFPGAEPAAPASVAAYAAWLMDRDRKSTGLKMLQGHIWEVGYQAGELRGHVYSDVPPAIRRWRAAGHEVAIYSSGSEHAQRRLFESTEHGDLAALMSGFFDTRVGAKVEAESYVRIAAALRRDPAAILFVSDVTAELAAASSIGLVTVLSVRPGNPPQPNASDFESIQSFDELV